MVADNPVWGAASQGELLKLGIEGSRTTVAKYAAGRKPPSQGWKTFLKNHCHEIVSVDYFTVPTITCQILYAFLMVEALGIEDVPTAPWQNPYIETRIGTVRRDCLDHVIVLNERHLHRVLAEYVEYSNESRTHLEQRRSVQCHEQSNFQKMGRSR